MSAVAGLVPSINNAEMSAWYLFYTLPNTQDQVRVQTVPVGELEHALAVLLEMQGTVRGIAPEMA